MCMYNVTFHCVVISTLFSFSLTQEQLPGGSAGSGGSGGGGGGAGGGAQGRGPPRVMPVTVPVTQSPGTVSQQIQQVPTY